MPRRSLASVTAALTGALLLAGCGSSAAHHPKAAPGTCPLTGTPAPGGHPPQRVAVAVKVGNEPAARPQTGLSAADIVFEEPIEGDITRLLAVYQCQQPTTVGPVRSTRWIDMQLLKMFGHPAFAFAGGIDPDLVLVRTSGVTDLNFIRAASAYHRTSDRVPPDNLFVDTTALWRLAGQGAAPAAVFQYASAPPAGTPSRGVTLTYSSIYSSGWRWQGGHWVWYVNGAPTTVTMTNVVVLYVTTHPGPYVEDSLGHHGVHSDTTGSGRALVFRDGMVVQATWHRASVTDPFTLTGPHGAVSLAPGNTWVALLPVTSSAAILGG